MPDAGLSEVSGKGPGGELPSVGSGTGNPSSSSQPAKAVDTCSMSSRAAAQRDSISISSSPRQT